MPTLTIKPSPPVKRAIIVLSCPYKASWDLLNQLKNGCYLSSNASTFSPCAVLLHCLKLHIDDKFNATPLESTRSKHADITVDIQKNNAIFTIYTEPSFTAVRKALDITFKNLTPNKLQSRYNRYVQTLGEKPDSGHFNYAVSEFNKGAKAMEVFITGTIRLPDDGEKRLKDVMNLHLEETGKAIPLDSKDNSREEISTSNKFDAFLVQQLFRTISIESYVINGNVIPIKGTSSLETIKNKMTSERIERFIEQKIMRLGDKLENNILFECASTGYFTSGELSKLPKCTKASLVSSLKKYF